MSGESERSPSTGLSAPLCFSREIQWTPPHPPSSRSLFVLPQDDSSVRSEDMDMAEPTWVSAEPPVPELSPPNAERLPSPRSTLKEEEGETGLLLCTCVHTTLNSIVRVCTVLFVISSFCVCLCCVG